MPRRPRMAMGGLAYHVLNRAVRCDRLFDTQADYSAFERVLIEAWKRTGTRILSYCVMPNHWHLVLWPRADGELSEFMRWLTVTHTQRWHAHRHTSGTGPIYQGRFKSFPIKKDDHLLTVCRYVERNARRAALAKRAQDWRWCSLARRRGRLYDDQASGDRKRGRSDAVDKKTNGDETAERRFLLPTANWPVAPPRNWLALVNRGQRAKELEAVRHSVKRGVPFGDTGWQNRTAAKLGLTSTLRPQGRPKNQPNNRN